MDTPKREIKINEVNIYDLLGRKESMIASLMAEIERLNAVIEAMRPDPHAVKNPTEK